MMLKQMYKYKWYLLAVLGLIILEPSLNSILNFLLQRMFNMAKPGGDKIEFLRVLSAGFLLWMAKRVAVYSNGVIKTRFICNAKRDLKHDLFAKLIGLNTANLADIASGGEYISIFTNDITLLETRFYNQLIGIVSGLFSLAILGTSFVALSAKLAFPIIGFGVVSMLVPVFFSKLLNDRSMAYSNAISRFTQKVKEIMTAYPTIKNYSIEDEISVQFNRENSAAEEAKFDADCTLILANSIGQLLAWFMQLIAVGLGLACVIKGEMLVGTVIAAQSFASDLAGPLNSMIVNINSIRSVRNLVRKMNDMASGGELESSEVGRETMDPVTEGAPETFDVKFDDLNLTLGDTPVIRHFSFCFEIGKKYLIVGMNGSGKSTLFKALKRWYGDPGNSIAINDCPLSSVSSAYLNRSISYLNENVSLFSGSVRDNITLFRSCSPGAFDKAVEDAQVNLDLGRSVNDEGKNISSGELRRIEIARSFLTSVRMIIFDEVASMLDIESAYEIEKMALDLKGKTVVFISHNFSGKLIREYDDILVMQDGKLLDHGPYDELIGHCDYFRKICDIKFGDIK